MSQKKGLYIRLDAETEAKLRDLAARDGETLGAVVARALDLLLAGPSDAARAPGDDDAKVRAALRADRAAMGA